MSRFTPTTRRKRRQSGADPRAPDDPWPDKRSRTEPPTRTASDGSARPEDKTEQTQSRRLP